MHAISGPERGGRDAGSTDRPDNVSPSPPAPKLKTVVAPAPPEDPLSNTEPSPFTPQVIEAVTAHMNTDHPEDNLLIARSLGGLPTATAATMIGLDPQGARFAAHVDGTTTEFDVPWAVEITERATIRHEVVRMYHEACEALGITPRGAGEH